MKVILGAQEEQLHVGSMPSDPSPLHIHETVEISCVLSGSCAVHIDSKPYTLTAGDLIIIFPLLPHSIDVVSEDCESFSARFLPDTISEFARTFRAFVPEMPVVHNALNSDTRYLIERLQAVPDGEPCPLRQAYLHMLLAYMLERMNLQPTGTGDEHPLAIRAIWYIYEHACENISLDSVADGLGISKSHLSRLFSTQFRVNFRRFINATRINKAIVQMRNSTDTLAQICFSCGYENMRTFRRAFVLETGRLPSDYLQHIRAAESSVGKPDGE